MYDPIEESILTTSKEIGDDGDGGRVTKITEIDTHTDFMTVT